MVWRDPEFYSALELTTKSLSAPLVRSSAVGVFTTALLQSYATGSPKPDKTASSPIDVMNSRFNAFAFQGGACPLNVILGPHATC